MKVFFSVTGGIEIKFPLLFSFNILTRLNDHFGSNFFWIFFYHHHHHHRLSFHPSWIDYCGVILRTLMTYFHHHSLSIFRSVAGRLIVIIIINVNYYGLFVYLHTNTHTLNIPRILYVCLYWILKCRSYLVCSFGFLFSIFSYLSNTQIVVSLNVFFIRLM